MQIFYRVTRPITPSLQPNFLVIVSPEVQASGNSIYIFSVADSEYVELVKKPTDEVAREYWNNDVADAVLLWRGRFALAH